MDNPASLGELIDTRACDHGEQPFLIDAESGRVVEYADLQSKVRAVAAFVASRGVEPGQSVAYAMHNGYVCAITILGLLYGGYRAVAVNLVAGRDVIAYVLSHSEAALVLTQAEHEGLIREALRSDVFTRADRGDKTAGKGLSGVEAGPPLVLLDEALLDDIMENGSGGEYPGKSRQASPAIDVDCPVDGQTDGVLMYTSGTTGRPKGVVLSHGNLLAGGRNVVLAHGLTSSDRALCVLPLYHINGLCVTLLGPLLSAGSAVFPVRFSTSGFWQWIDRFQCTWFSVVPTQIAYLLRDAGTAVQRPLLRFGRSASAPLSPAVHDSFERLFGIALIETMGLTETAAQILSNPLPPGVRKLGSPGVPFGDEVRVVDASLSDVPAGCEGELLIRGPNVMQRYFKDPAATREAVTAEGWLRTGDMGYRDQDGYLFITGRLKELIIKGGENIAPREIDDALYQHADVIEAAAFAIPCERFGQRVEAAVSLKASSSLDEASLIRLCAERVGAFKCPDRIHFMDELPKGPSGKIQRQKLPDLVNESR